ncbi:MAG TPA: hypothetical protein VGL19_12620, partial [Polyangiaceae bacterium]
MLSLAAVAFAVTCTTGVGAEPANARASLRSRPLPLIGAAAALRFEPNVGQFASNVRYLARGRAYALFLTSEGATLALHRPFDTTHAARPDAPLETQSVVTMKLKGAAAVEPRGILPVPGRSNYFTGDDPAAWRAGVQSFERVRYESVLPGVDVEYHGSEGR